MYLDRTNNTKRNMSFGLINKFITLLLPFLVRTVFIRSLGSGYLGLNSLFVSILQVLNLTELGFSSAIVFSLYKPISTNDIASIRSFMAYYRHIYHIVGCVILLLGIILLPFLSCFIRGDIPENANIYILYLMYLANTCLTYFLFSYKQALLDAMQRVDVISNIQSITTVLMSFGQMAVLFLWNNYYAYLLIMMVATLLNNLILSYYVNKYYPVYNAGGHLLESAKKKIHTQIAGLMIDKFCAISRNSFDGIFISAFLGLSITGIYSNYYYVIAAVTGIMAIIPSSLQGGVGNTIAVENSEKNYQDMRKMNFLYMGIGGWCTICLLCLYQPFMQLWVGNELMFSYQAVILFSIYFYMLKMGDIRSMYVQGTGIWWHNRYRAIMEGVSNLILAFVLVQFWGIYGVITATIISLFVFNFCYGSQIIFRYFFKNGKIKEYFKDHAIYLGVTGIVAVITISLENSILLKAIDMMQSVGVTQLIQNWIILIIRAVLSCIIPIMLYFWAYHKTQIYKEAMTWLLPKIWLGEKMRRILLK